jgi:hypothetical protein
MADSVISSLKSEIKTHLFYVVLIAVGIFGFHYWSLEHTQRILAEQTIKQSQATIQTLQQQITTTNAQAAQKVQVITKIVHDLGPAPTPAQVVAVVPQLTEMPLNARVAVDNPTQVSVDAVPLVSLLAQASTDHINLGACQVDLKAETAISAQKDIQIAALKRKKPLLKRIEHGLEIFGAGALVTLVLVH